MRLEFLGTGASFGVPQIGCSCEVCVSDDPRDRRTRCSIWVQHEEKNLIVDTSLDFRFQCLRSRIPNIGGIFCTHFHADHIFGLDDIRQFNHRQKEAIPIYIPDFMIERFQECFGYTLEGKHTLLSRPRLSMYCVEYQFILFHNLTILPVDVWHGKERIKGYVFQIEDKKIAYLTDCKTLPEETIAQVRHADIIILSALWKNHTPHPAHLTLEEAIELAQILEGKQTYLTHISHKMGLYQETERELPDTIHLAYDGLVLSI